MRKTNLTGSLPHWVREWGAGDFEARVNLKGWASREAPRAIGPRKYVLGWASNTVTPAVNYRINTVIFENGR